MCYKQNENAEAKTSNDGDGDCYDCAYYSGFNEEDHCEYYNKQIRDRNEATHCPNYDSY